MTHYFKEKIIFGLSSLMSSAFSGIGANANFTLASGDQYNTLPGIFVKHSPDSGGAGALLYVNAFRASLLTNCMQDVYNI